MSSDDLRAIAAICETTMVRVADTENVDDYAPMLANALGQIWAITQKPPPGFTSTQWAAVERFVQDDRAHTHEAPNASDDVDGVRNSTDGVSPPHPHGAPNTSTANADERRADGRATASRQHSRQHTHHTDRQAHTSTHTNTGKQASNEQQQQHKQTQQQQEGKKVREYE